MAYAIRRGRNSIVKISGDPRSPSNLKGVIVWDETKSGVKRWVKRYGSKSQKENFL